MTVRGHSKVVDFATNLSCNWQLSQNQTTRLYYLKHI